jgi:streptomycin 3"-adenylyltransferase
LTGAEARQLEAVVWLVRAVLGQQLVGAYLFGSATMGGLRPHSDLDVLAVTARSASDTERRRLVDGLLASRGPRPVELTTVAESEIRPWRYPPQRDFQYGEWLREELEAGVDPPRPVPDPDLAPLIRMTLLADRPLFGPPPAEVFDPVPDDDFLRAMTTCVDDVLRGLDEEPRNMVLTLARVWSSVETGELCSKDEAAAWALDRLPEEHRAVLAHARAVYLGEADERWDELRPHIRAHADYVAGRVRDAKRPPAPARRGPATA